MNELRKLFAELKPKCKTVSQMRTFNNLVKSFNSLSNLSKPRKSFERISLENMCNELGLNIDNIENPDTEVLKNIFNDYTRYYFSLQDPFRIFDMYILDGRILVVLQYNTDDSRSKLVRKIINQKDKNGDSPISIAKSFASHNLDELQEFIFSLSK